MNDETRPEFWFGGSIETVILLLALSPILFSAIVLVLLGVAKHLNDRLARKARRVRKPPNKPRRSHNWRQTFFWILPFLGATSSADGSILNASLNIHQRLVVESPRNFIAPHLLTAPMSCQGGTHLPSSPTNSYPGSINI